LGREALRTGGKILTDIADNPQTGIKEIILKHVQSIFQNLGIKMTVGGRKRKRRSTSRVARKSKRPKRTQTRVTRRRTTPLTVI